MKKVYGIDLGATFSCIAHIGSNDEAEVIHSERSHPSCFKFHNHRASARQWDEHCHIR